jgi:hypothetical protein
LIRTRVIGKPFPKTSPQFRSSSDRSGSGGPKHHDRSAAHFTLPLVGRVAARFTRGGVGVERFWSGVVAPHCLSTPTPNPSPQGGGESTKGGRTPTDAVPQPLHRLSAARTLQGALACRRSTNGSRQTVVTFWLSSRPCFLRLGGSARSYGPPSGEDRNAFPRALPAPACPSPGFQHPHRS